MVDILVISSHFNTRIAYTAALTGYGFEVVEAPSIDQAQDLLRSGMTARAIVIDVKYTPSLRDAYNEFAGMYAGVERPALIVIGGKENAQLAEGVADLFLPRPVEIYDLIGSVQQCIA